MPAACPDLAPPSAAPSAIPHRKLIRAWLAPLASRSTAYALALTLVDLLLLGAALTATVAFETLPMKLLAGMAAGFVIGRLFILGHDACHQSLTPHRRLNRWLGRLVFLPSLTPYSLWEVGHNVVHHGYTNLKGFDFVWEPRTLEAYRALPRWRRRLERVYRSGWAPWLYYLVEIWWNRLLFPNRRTMPTRRAAFFWDGVLVVAGAAAWIAGLVAAAAATGQSATFLVLTGFVLPFVFWNGMIGFVVYVHHTHTGVAWYEDKRRWADAQPFVSTTVHLTFRSFMGSALHHIMEHTAHHVDMSVPLYRLKRAQRLLEERLAGHIVVQPFSWRWYADTARRCKLYDFEAGCWTDFSGRRTSTPLAAG
ncbi:fatty acid desaturase [Methylibium petroleiphilum]|uniref:Putative fatty acid desaturase n=1 Tax=Methylibium petroleiphilum (strain ATCC BAA-1232 / LMG 22953 / PM1) TaxID=420662 RepID=A2SLW0_METPP|nr:fatty acid desaturase [Methylibium petroleiphilum]ABM96549.1 putative fatty acid desaturase [Methylibium petroleiphilum PM1]